MDFPLIARYLALRGKLRDRERWPRERYWVPTFAETFQEWKP